MSTDWSHNCEDSCGKFLLTKSKDAEKRIHQCRPDSRKREQAWLELSISIKYEDERMLFRNHQKCKYQDQWCGWPEILTPTVVKYGWKN